MIYTLTVQIEAWLEIQNAYDWYEEQKLGLGDAFIEQVELCYRALIKNPERFPYINHLYRRIKTNRFPYLVLYEIEGSNIIVGRVRHVKQLPV